MRRHHRIIGLLLLGSVPIVAGMTYRPYEVAPDCDSAKAWVTANDGYVPKSLAEYSRLPQAYRVAIGSKLSTEAKRALWYEHLSIVLQEPSLTEAQRGYIARIRSGLDRYLRADITEDEAKQYSDEAKAILGFTIAKWAVVSLGEREPQQASSASDSTGDCTCNQYDDWCGFFECQDVPCREIPVECGWLGSLTCNGICGAGTGAER